MVMTSQHIGINDNLKDNKKAVEERCKKINAANFLTQCHQH